MLSLACLASGFANYVRTVRRYSERRALVETGWKTQAVVWSVALVIVGSCVVLLVADVRGAASVTGASTSVNVSRTRILVVR